MARRRRRKPRKQKNVLDRWSEKQFRKADERERARKQAEADQHTANVRRRDEELERMLVDRPQGLHSRRPDLSTAFASGGADALNGQVQYILDSGDRPRLFPRSSQARYRPESREIQVLYELPGRDMTPPWKGSRYIKSRNVVEKIKRDQRELKQAQRRVIARTMLRALADVFDTTPPDLVRSVAVNGYIPGEDPSTGKPQDLVIASARADRSTFGKLVLTAPGLDPLECLRRFDTRISKDPYAPKPIVPIVRFDPAGPGSDGDSGAFATAGPRLDLLAISPREFEHIVHKLAAVLYGHATQTPQTGDGGVDVFAVAENEITGITYAIEAKQYRRAVPVKEVRSLHGAMTKANVHHGVVVTTAWFSQDGYDHAEGSRMTLIDGKRLRYLLAKYCSLDTVIPLPKLPTGWSQHDVT